MMRPKNQRSRWTHEEDQKLFECKSGNPQQSWPNIARRAGLNRSGKSCRERWNTRLSPLVKRGSFSEEEDDIIIHLRSLHGNSWAYIATQLPGRSDNAIKNRWNNHLKKKLAPSTHQNMPDPRSCTSDQPDATQLFHPTSISSHPEPLIAGFSFFIPNVNPNETNFEGDYFEPGISGFSSLIPNVNLNETNFGGDYFEPGISGFSSLIPNVNPNETNFGGDYIEPGISGFSSLIPNVNPNETNFGGDYFEPEIFGFSSLILNVNPNETNFGGDYFEPGISEPVSTSVENEPMPTEQVTRYW